MTRDEHLQETWGAAYRLSRHAANAAALAIPDEGDEGYARAYQLYCDVVAVWEAVSAADRFVQNTEKMFVDLDAAAAARKAAD